MTTLDRATAAQMTLLDALLAATRKGSDATSLAVASLAGLILAIPVSGLVWPANILFLTHIVFWIAALVILRWSLPRGQPISWRRVLTGATVSGAVAAAAMLFMLVSLSRGLPSAGQVYAELNDLPSLIITLVLVGPAVVVGRNVLIPDIGLEGPDSRIARQSQEALSVIFHELRRPLTLLVLSSELALDPMTPEPKRRELLESVHRHAMRVGKDLEELLECMRIQASKLRINRRPMDLVELTHEVVGELRELRRSGEIEVVVRDPDVGLVSADPERLKTVLRNLVANAIKHSPMESPITVTLWSERARVGLSVEDEGPGVPAAYRELIFELFFQAPGTAGGGFGLGLYLSRQLVKAHGGEIWVEDRQIRGARFVVSLPGRLAMGTSVVGPRTDSPHPAART